MGTGSRWGRRPRAANAKDLEGVAAATVNASRALLGLVVISLAPALERVSLAQFRVLVLLAALGPMRSGVLAERLGIHQSTLTRTADRLVRTGLLERSQNPVNRREVMLDATAEGRSLVRTVVDRRYQEVLRVVSQVPARRRSTILKGMQAFAEAAGEPAIDLLAFVGG